MTAAFETAFEITVGHEGSTLDLTRSDRGNWTSGIVGQGTLKGSKYGISAMSYPTVDIANLTLDGAKAIYAKDFWAKISGDRLPLALAVLVFDAAVNSGVSRASRWLQVSVGADQDGWIGDMTIKAVQKAVASGSLKAVCAENVAQRFTYLPTTATWGVDDLGWSRRVASLTYQSAGLM